MDKNIQGSLLQKPHLPPSLIHAFVIKVILKNGLVTNFGKGVEAPAGHIFPMNIRGGGGIFLFVSSFAFRKSLIRCNSLSPHKFQFSKTF